MACYGYVLKEICSIKSPMPLKNINNGFWLNTAIHVSEAMTFVFITSFRPEHIKSILFRFHIKSKSFILIIKF